MYEYLASKYIVSMAELNLPQPSKKRGRPPGNRVLLNGDKEARKQNFMKKIFDDDKATKTASFYKRKPTLMKKAEEIRILCDVPVCVVCFAPNGSVDVWPEDKQCAREVMSAYQRLHDKEKKELNVFEFLRHKKQKLEKKVQQMKINTLVASLSEYIDGLSESTPLMDLVNDLEGKVKSLKERIELLRSESKGKMVVKEEINPERDELSATDNGKGVQVGDENFDGRSWVWATNSSDGFKPREENIEENFENLFIPIDHPRQISYIHDALPFSVWQPAPEALLKL
ncbi:agamous-like MADS-box protein AGL81 [Mercurialis annua]|uniref:agamous-like MADS-box protein AGL81 n=1 Tax=Mercurialis annua TaxID=3986 RepID=UPI0024AEA190|nr:agamous-like MADS-box protein AGL81 [Mercurialis annua]